MHWKKLAIAVVAAMLPLAAFGVAVNLAGNASQNTVSDTAQGNLQEQKSPAGVGAVTDSDLPYKLEVNRKSIDVVPSASDYDSFNDVVKVKDMDEGKKAVTIQLVNTEQLKENFEHLYLELEKNSGNTNNVEAPSAFMTLSLDNPKETTWIDVGGAGNNGGNNPGISKLDLNMNAYYT